MALFLVTCVRDEGVSESSFRVVKAASKAEVAQAMRDHYERWQDFTLSSIFYRWLEDEKEGPHALWARMRQVILNAEDGQQLRTAFKRWFLSLSPESILHWIERTRVDGDSSAQLAIYEIKEIEAGH